MNKKNITILVVVALSFLAGRFFSPAKVQIKEVVKSNESTEKNKNVTVTTKETTLPDGTKIKEVVKSKETTDKKQVSKESISEKTIENRPDWNFTVVYEPAIPNAQEETFQGIIQKRIISEIYLGVSARSDKQYGISISLGF